MFSFCEVNKLCIKYLLTEICEQVVLFVTGPAVSWGDFLYLEYVK